MRRHDGVYRTFSVRAVPVTDERGENLEWVGAHTDITEQREAEQHVRDSLRRLELALDAASVGMWDWDLDRGTMTWTRQTHLITGIAPGDFTGALRTVFRTAVAAWHRSRRRVPAGTSTWPTPSNKPSSRSSGRMARAAGSRIAPTAISGQHRALAPHLGTLRDVTRRKELESEREALLTAERAARSELVDGRAGQGRIPRHDLPRAAHAAQRHAGMGDACCSGHASMPPRS